MDFQFVEGRIARFFFDRKNNSKSVVDDMIIMANKYK